MPAMEMARSLPVRIPTDQRRAIRSRLFGGGRGSYRGKSRSSGRGGGRSRNAGNCGSRGSPSRTRSATQDITGQTAQQRSKLAALQNIDYSKEYDSDDQGKERYKLDPRLVGEYRCSYLLIIQSHSKKSSND